MAKPGDLSRDVYTAAWYNKIEKLAAKHLGVPAGQIVPSVYQTIRINNVSGSPLKRWQVVRYTFEETLVDYGVTIDHRHNHIVANTTTTGEQYAVMLDGTPDGRLGEALVVGRTFVLLDTVNQATEYHNFLRLDSAQVTEFVTFGNIEVHNKFTAATESIGYCTIGNINPIETGIAKTTSAITARTGLTLGTGTADDGVVDYLFDTVGYTGPSVNLFNSATAAIPTDTQVPYIVVQGIRIALPQTTTGTTTTTTISFTLTTNLTTTGTGTITATSDATNYPLTTSVTLTNPTAFLAYSGATGTAILVGAIWVILEVNRPEALIHVTFSSASHDWSAGDLARGFDADQVAITTSFDKGLSSYPVNWIKSSITISNPYNHNWLSGDRGLLRKEDESNYFVVKVFHQICSRFRFVLTADSPTGIAPNLTATAIAPIGSDSGPPPTGSITIKDIYGLAHNAKTGHKGIAEYDYNNGWYYATECEHNAWRLRGTLNGTLSGGAATFSVIPVIAFDGKLPSSPITVYNKFSWDAGTTGYIVAVEWNPVDGQYEAYQMRCPA